jgi:hypothetical protein
MQCHTFEIGTGQHDPRGWKQRYTHCLLPVMPVMHTILHISRFFVSYREGVACRVACMLEQEAALAEKRAEVERVKEAVDVLQQNLLAKRDIRKQLKASLEAEEMTLFLKRQVADTLVKLTFLSL